MIQGISNKILRDFRGGRMTSKNLAGFPPEFCLIAKDVFFLGDGAVRRRKGYTLVRNIGASVQSLFDFHRQSDQKQYLVANYGSKLGLMNPDGSTAPTVLSGSEDATKKFAFATNPYGLFASNGSKSYAVYNVSATETIRTWGIDAPQVAPTIDTSIPSSLTLEYGRQYVFCYVIKWQDAQGTQHYHVGPPSPISAGTGPITNKLVTLGSMMRSSNPAVTHKWIFATTDQPADQSADFLFAAEIADSVTSWGDSLSDDSLDYTRVAPWENYPAPLAQWLIEYQGRIVALGVPGDEDTVYLSGLGEVDLGVPEESFPTGVRFKVPGGIKQLSGGASFQQSLMLSTPEFWFQVTGTDATNFQKRDKLISPGAAGWRCIVSLQNMLIWLAPDKKVWSWDGASLPIELSYRLSQPSLLPGVPSMDDLNEDQLTQCELRVYNFGRYHFLVVGAYLDDTPHFTWLQLWDASSLVTSTGWRTYLSDGSTVGMAESDMFPADPITTMGNVEVGNTQWLYMGDSAGNIFRWPDGFTDNGKIIKPQWGTSWLDLDQPGVRKKMLWADLSTDRDTADTSWTSISAVASPGLNMKTSVKTVPTGSKPSPEGIDHSIVRAKLQQQGTSVGEWLRLVIDWPADDQEATLQQLEISSRPISQVNP